MKVREAFIWLFYFLMTIIFCLKGAFSVKEIGFSVESLFFFSLAGVGFYCMLTSKTP